MILYTKGTTLMTKFVKPVIIAAVAVLVVGVLFLNSIDTVPVGSTGILLTLGRVEEDKALSEGMHLKIPFIQKIVSMDNRVKKLELSTEAFSKDIQTVSATLAVNYRMGPPNPLKSTRNTAPLMRTTSSCPPPTRCSNPFAPSIPPRS